MILYLGYSYCKDQTLGLIPHLQDQIQTLQNQVDSLAQQVEILQQQIIQLESKLEKSKYPIRGTLKHPDNTKTIQQSDSTLEVEKGLYLTENDTQINMSLEQIQQPILKTDSETSKIDFKTSERSEQYNIVSDQFKPQNNSNFITFGKISEDEKIEIIQTGFQLEAESKISLKKYYESTDPYSLFQFKGYSIKYESIRRTSLYKSLKE